MYDPTYDKKRYDQDNPPQPPDDSNFDPLYFALRDYDRAKHALDVHVEVYGFLIYPEHPINSRERHTYDQISRTRREMSDIFKAASQQLILETRRLLDRQPKRSEDE